MARQLSQGTTGKCYGTSKLCQMLFTYEFHRRYGDTICCNAVTPGMVNTNLNRFMPWWQRILAAPLKPALLRSPAKGAETVLFAAGAPELEGVSGKYFGDVTEIESSPQSYDTDAAKVLWDLSVEWTDANIN